MPTVQKYTVKKVGTFGDIAAWSLQGQKTVTGGEGGIILTDDKNCLIEHSCKVITISVQKVKSTNQMIYINIILLVWD